MIGPFGPIGGPNLGLAAAPPQSVMRQRPLLQVILLGCTLAIIGKFVGRQQNTALSDLFPVIFGSFILYSQSHFYTCIMVFLLFAGMAFIFSTFYLLSELVGEATGGSNFFATTCPISFEIDFNKTKSLDVCDADIDDKFGNCDKPFTCNNTISTDSTMHLASQTQSQELWIWKELCSGYTIVGHVALIMSAIFNGLSTWIGWSMFKASQAASAGVLADIRNGAGQGGQPGRAGGQDASQRSEHEAFRGEGQTLGTS
eukprot:GEMP01022876.1.p1 GENE.GEMP01022876.1~~GEMP01022876.1.p1  ORF type:complete len:257 (-),score=43.39 GEMP01022876.1:1725-2495(-)